MADPVYVECSTACTVTVVHELAIPPLQLDTQAAGEIALAILGVWAVAWAFRMLIRAVNVDSNSAATSSDD